MSDRDNQTVLDRLLSQALDETLAQLSIVDETKNEFGYTMRDWVKQVHVAVDFLEQFEPIETINQLRSNRDFTYLCELYWTNQGCSPDITKEAMTLAAKILDLKISEIGGEIYFGVAEESFVEVAASILGE